MNRKHLIQFVATVGSVVVLYVLSYAPLRLYVRKDPYNTNWVLVDKVERRWYAPVGWLEARFLPLQIYETLWDMAIRRI